MEQSIARSAARLRLAVFAVAALMILLYGAARLGLQRSEVHVVMRTHGLAGTTAAVVGDLTMILMLGAMWELTRTLRLIGLGETFSVGVIRRFRAFAFWLLLMALLGFVAPFIGEVARWGSGAPHRMVVLLDLRQLLTLGIALLLFLLARLFERAGQIDAEIREFV